MVDRYESQRTPVYDRFDIRVSVSSLHHTIGRAPAGIDVAVDDESSGKLDPDIEERVRAGVADADLDVAAEEDEVLEPAKSRTGAGTSIVNKERRVIPMVLLLCPKNARRTVRLTLTALRRWRLSRIARSWPARPTRECARSLCQPTSSEGC
jgi:hypothetical protein